MESSSADMNVCVTSQKCQLALVILSTVSYCLFANGAVFIRFCGKDDNVVLELFIKIKQVHNKEEYL